MKIAKTIAFATALAAGFVVAASADALLPPVRIDSGQIVGTTRAGVNRFFGIPYAAPPVGDNRWRAPQPVKPWDHVKDASAFGPVCRQKPADWITEPQSEDCLTLNIWAPAKPGKYPVMVWIHGGGNVSGSGSQWGPDGGNGIAAHGMIMVTFNYRLGVMGYFAHPDLSAESADSGNQGVRDQIAVLKWVKANIAAFGGDPRRVTIAGQSAGAVSAAILTMAPAAKGLFQRVIAESGIADGLLPKAEGEKRAAAFTTSLNAAHIADLRKLDADTLIKAPWHGEVIDDGVAIRGDMAASYRAGFNNMVPIMMGWNSEEGRDLAPDILGTKSLNMTFHAMLFKGVFNGNVPAPIQQLYPGRTDTEAEESIYRFLDAMQAQRAFQWASLQTTAKAAPVYTYIFIHWPADPATTCTYGCKAGHAAEIRFALDQLALDPRPWTAGDKLIADRMVRYWTNFAKTGDPNSDGLPRWAPFDGTTASVQRLGTDAEIKERGAFTDLRPYFNPGQK